MEERRFPSFKFYQQAFLKELEFEGVNDTIKHMCRSRLLGLAAWYRREQTNPVMPISLEGDLSVSLEEGLIFKGKFDKIEPYSTHGVRVVDYKTGAPDKHVRAIETTKVLSQHECDDYYRQLIAYKLVFDKNQRAAIKKSVVKKGKLQFLEPASKTVKKYGLEKGQYRDIEIELTDEMVKELEMVIESAWKSIQALHFEKLVKRDDKERCRNCDFDTICWGA